MKLQQTSIYVGVVLALTLGVTACGGDKEKTAPTQVLARVNSKEITVHQLNFLLQKQPQSDKSIKQKALDTLVDQELLVQKAEELKLDRDPAVLQMIEQSRRQILAQSALQKLAGPEEKIDDAKIADFFNKNPQLFADRKIYTFDTFAFPKEKLTPTVQEALNAVTSVSETNGVLSQNAIAAQSKEMKVPAEQLPMPILQKAASMKNGDIVIFPEGGNAVLLQLREAVAAPVEQAQADTVIRRYLQNANRNGSIETAMKNLRTTGKVEYVQKFEDKPATPVATTPAPQASAATGVDQNQLKQALKGLK